MEVGGLHVFMEVVAREWVRCFWVHDADEEERFFDIDGECFYGILEVYRVF